MRSLSNFVFVLTVLLTANDSLIATYMTNEEIDRGIQLYKDGNLDEAKEFFRTFTKENPNNAKGMFYLGRILFDENKYKEAEKCFKRAVELDNNNSEYHTWLGNTYGNIIRRASFLKKAGLAEKIKKHFEIAVELDESNLDAREGLFQFYLEAPGIVGGSKDKARKQAEIIKKYDKFRGYRALGRIYEKEKKYDQAENVYKRAIEEFPEKINLRFQLGYFYQRQERFSEAFEVFEKMVEDSANNMGAIYQIGRTGALSGQKLDRAEECLKLYLQHEPGKTDPSLAAAHWRLGIIYEHKGQKELARKEYETALELEPEFEAAKKALKKLE